MVKIRGYCCRPVNLATLQIGRILEDLDALAGNIAFKHCSEDPSFPLLVTASVDRRVKPQPQTEPTPSCSPALDANIVWYSWTAFFGVFVILIGTIVEDTCSLPLTRVFDNMVGRPCVRDKAD